MKDAICVPRDGDILAALKTVLNAVQGRARVRTIPAEWAYEQTMQTARSHTEFALEMDGGSVSYAYTRKYPRSRPERTVLWVVVLDDVVWIKAWRGPCVVTRRSYGLSVNLTKIDRALALIDEMAADKWIRKQLLHLVMPPEPSILVELRPVTDNAAIVMDSDGWWYLATRYGWWEINIRSDRETTISELARLRGIPISTAEKIVDGIADQAEVEMELALAAISK